jgi:hypothetical protein
MTVPIFGEVQRGLTPRDLRRVVVGGLLLAALVGLVAGVSGGIGGAAIAGGLVAIVAITLVYIHRPFWVVVGFWIFLLLQDSIAAALGKSGGAGALVSKAENPMIAVLLLLSIIFGQRRPRGRWLLFIPGGVFFAAGFLSGIFNHIHPSILLLGAWLGIKAWVLFIIALYLPWNEETVMRMYRIIVGVAIPVALLTFVDLFAPGPFRSALGLPSASDVRLGIQAARSIFPNPALLSSFMFLSLCLLVARMSFVRKRHDILWAGTLSVAAVLSLRFKAVLGIATAFAIVATFRPRALGKAVGPRVVFLLLAAVIVGGIGYGVASRQVSTYASTETPRTRLTATAVTIAEADFPLGVGFGHYGSAPSSFPYPYSPVYNKYGFWMINGLDKLNPAFLHDTSWATVIGETGALGWLAYAGGLVLLIGVLALQARNDKQSRVAQMASLAGLATMVAFLFDSAGRPALFDAFTCLSVGLVIAPALALGRMPGARPELPDAVERILASA